MAFAINNVQGQNLVNQKDNRTQEEQLMELGKMFVKILNAPTDEMAEQFAYLVYIPEQAEGLASLLRNEFGEIEVGRIRIMSHSIHVVAKVKKLNEWRNFQIGLTETKPRKGKGLFIGLAAAPVIIPPGEISDAKVLAKLNEYIDQLIEEGDLSGSVLIAEGEKVLFERAFGMANRETSRKNTLSTPFNLASSSKMFTAVAVMKLVQKGTLDLNDPVIKFFPNYPNKEFAQRATVAHLLSHASGLGDFWDDEYEKHWHEISTLEQYLPFITSKPLRFENPGEGGSYSNSGFILLGLIIEKVTGENYYAYMQKTIFDPLRMENTGFYTKDQDDLIAVGYSISGSGLERARGGLRGSSAGGAFSTGADMLKFKTALTSNKLLNKKLTDLLTSPQATLERLTYGYGFVINESGFGHGGMAPGASVTFEVDTTSDYTLIYFSNHVSGGGMELLFTIKEVMAK